MTARYWLFRFAPEGSSAPPFAVWVESAAGHGHRMRGDFHGGPEGADRTWWREYLDDTGSSGDLDWVLANWHDWLSDLQALSERERSRELERASIRHANIHVDGPFEIGDEVALPKLLDQLHDTRVLSPFDGRVGRIVYAAPSTDARKLFRRTRVTFHNRQTSFQMDYTIEAQVAKEVKEGRMTWTFATSDMYSRSSRTRLVKRLTLVRLVDAPERLNDEIEALAPLVRAGDPAIRVAIFVNADELPASTPERAGVTVIPAFAPNAHPRFGSIWMF
jgi:hypothetical protein